MLRNDEIQAALVDYAKGKSDFTDELKDGADEIREDEWKGRDFTYPNIRLRIISNEPLDKQCNLHRVLFSWMAFSEDASSQEADRIAGIINNTLHDTSFQSNNISFNVRTTNLVPAIAIGENVWRAETIQEASVSG
jgi:hypothetical protein